MAQPAPDTTAPTVPASATAPAPEARHARGGLLYGFSAHAIWGFAPLYFHQMAEVAPWLIVCHRICWSALFLAVVVSARKEWDALRRVMRSPRSLVLLTVAASLIATNWLIFIYAITSHQVLQASLGYFINPLISVVLGTVFLGERLRGWQWFAVLLAAAAVVNLAVRGSGLPWIALTLAITFAFYGFVRKKIDINSLHGLLVESGILLPLSLGAIFFVSVPAMKPVTWALLAGSGIITAVPLLLFGAAVRRVQLSTLGFLQYIGPTLQMLVALVLFREPLDPAKLASFALCWVAIAVYVTDSLLTRRPPPVTCEPD